MSPPVDCYPRIVFGRTQMSLAAIVSGQLNSPVRDVRVERAITGINTVVTSFQQDQTKNLDQFEYCEIVAVSPVMASAPPIEVKETFDDEYEGEDASSEIDDEQYQQAEDDDSDDGYDDYWGGPRFEDRPSSEIERDLQVVGLSEVPIFGRRLLLVSFNRGLSEFDMDKAKQRLRKRLGLPVTVWQGRSFEGYCFVDNATPLSIVSRLEKTLVCDEVEDYLLVQPVAMVLQDKSGLSPLGDWIAGGWKTRPVNIPHHRRDGPGG
jgi:hypothetical protein